MKRGLLKRVSLSLACCIAGIAACSPTPKSIELTPNSLALTKLDESRSVQATAKDSQGAVIPEAKITWNSSDPSIAVVDETGLVVAKKSGKATVTAKAGNVQAELPVNVTIYAKMALDNTPLNLKVSEAKRLEVKVLNEAGIIIPAQIAATSSDPAVARVDAQNNITAVSPGAAVISFAAQDLSSNVPVTVTPGQVTLLQVEPTATMAVGESRGLTVKGVDATNFSFPVNVTWTSANSKVVSIASDGQVKALKAGQVTLTATHAESGKKATVKVTVK